MVSLTRQWRVWYTSRLESSFTLCQSRSEKRAQLNFFWNIPCSPLPTIQLLGKTFHCLRFVPLEQNIEAYEYQREQSSAGIHQMLNRCICLSPSSKLAHSLSICRLGGPVNTGPSPAWITLWSSRTARTLVNLICLSPTADRTGAKRVWGSMIMVRCNEQDIREN